MSLIRRNIRLDLLGNGITELIPGNGICPHQEPAVADLSDGAFVGTQGHIPAADHRRAVHHDIGIVIVDGHIAVGVLDLPKDTNIRFDPFILGHARTLDGNGRFHAIGAAADRLAAITAQLRSGRHQAVIVADFAALVLDDHIAHLQVQITVVDNVHLVGAFGIQAARAADFIRIDNDVAAGYHDVRQGHSSYAHFIQHGVVLDEAVGFHHGAQFIHFRPDQLVFIGIGGIFPGFLGKVIIPALQAVVKGHVRDSNRRGRQPVTALVDLDGNTASIHTGVLVRCVDLGLPIDGDVQIRMDACRNGTACAHLDSVLRSFIGSVFSQCRRGDGPLAARARVDIVLASTLGNGRQAFAGLEVRVADGADHAVDIDLVGLAHGVLHARIDAQGQGSLVVGVGNGVVVEYGPQAFGVGTGIEVHVIGAFQHAAADVDGIGPSETIVRRTGSRAGKPSLGVGHGLEGSGGVIAGRQRDILIGLVRRQG